MKSIFRSPSIFSKFQHVIAAESTRHGGVSRAPYHSLNLGKSTDDDPSAIEENRRRFFAAFGAVPNQLAFAGQIHGAEIWQAEATGFAGIGYDALITNQSGIFVGITIADCAPILIFDPENKAVAAIHAGWRGTAAEIAHKTLSKMSQAYGTRPENCLAYVGVCIDVGHFEVGDEVAVQFADAFKHFDEGRGKFCLDLKKANTAQLINCGVPASQIEVSPYSTAIHRDDYFSHRLDGGTTGRMLAVIGLC